MTLVSKGKKLNLKGCKLFFILKTWIYFSPLQKLISLLNSFLVHLLELEYQPFLSFYYFG